MRDLRQTSVPWMAALAVAGALTIIAPAPAGAATTLTVDSTTDAPLADPSGTACVSTSAHKCTLRAAVQAADNLKQPVTIRLPAGSYGLTIPRANASDPADGDLDVLSGATITIDGAGAGSTEIAVDTPGRAFNVASYGTLTVDGITITGGNEDTITSSDPYGEGGAILSDGELTVEHCVLEHDQAGDGGGALESVGGGTMAIVDSTISADATVSGDASAPGGAVASYSPTRITGSSLTGNITTALVLEGGSPVTISHSVIDRDSGNDAGGIVLEGTTAPVTVVSSDISQDSASVGAGGIHGDPQSLTLSDSRLAEDSGLDGGGMEVNAMSITVSGDTFAEDSATGSVPTEGGGGLAALVTKLVLTDSTFVGDSTTQAGGGLLLWLGDDGTAAIADDTFEDNDASEGGAIYVHAGEGAVMTNDTIAYNVANQAGGLGAGSGTSEPLTSVGARLTAIANTIVADNVGGDCGGGAVGTTVDHGHNLDSDGSCFGTGTPPNPEVAGDLIGRDPRLATLASNGGPAQTAALELGSPAIGAGLASACPKDDQRGVAFESACDIGAFHYQAKPRGLTLKLRRHRRSLEVSGRLELPAGVVPRYGYAGEVTIVAKHASKRLFAKTVKLTSRGGYVLTRKLGAKLHGRLSVDATFAGNDALLAATSKPSSVNVPKARRQRPS